MEKIFFKLIAISLILAGSFSCNEKEDIQIEGIQKEVQENVPTEDIQKEDDQTEDDQTEETCNIDNPLIDLPWLAARINEINLLSQKKERLSVYICQCTYEDGKTGFWENDGNMAYFYNCEGKILCTTDGSTEATCTVDFVTQKLLWIIEKTTEYSIDENPPCGINDPLENIKWLKEYCESINEIEDLSSINIDIYKVIDKDEYLFFVKYSIEYQDYKRVRLNSINCNGDTVFHFTWMYGKRGFVPVPPNLARYDEFMEDKEFVAGLLYFVK